MVTADEELEQHTVGVLEDHENRLTRLEHRDAVVEVQHAVDVLTAHEGRLVALDQLVPRVERLEARLQRGVWRIAGVSALVGLLVGSCGACGPRGRDGGALGRDGREELRAARANEALARRRAEEAADACERLALRYDEPVAFCH